MYEDFGAPYVSNPKSTMTPGMFLSTRWLVVAACYFFGDSHATKSGWANLWGIRARRTFQRIQVACRLPCLTTVIYSGRVQVVAKRLVELAAWSNYGALRQGAQVEARNAVFSDLGMSGGAAAGVFVRLHSTAISFGCYAEFFRHETVILYLMLRHLVGLLACAAYTDGPYILAWRANLRSGQHSDHRSGHLHLGKADGARRYGFRGLAMGTPIFGLLTRRPSLSFCFSLEE